MKLLPTTKLHEIDLLFCERFPGLKLEFFVHPHDIEEHSPIDEVITEDLMLKNLDPKFQEKIFPLTALETVAKFESRFLNELSINVQVYRKSGLNWLQTTKTDHWTLEEQMKHAHD